MEGSRPAEFIWASEGACAYGDRQFLRIEDIFQPKKDILNVLPCDSMARDKAESPGRLVVLAADPDPARKKLF